MKFFSIVIFILLYQTQLFGQLVTLKKDRIGFHVGFGSVLNSSNLDYFDLDKKMSSANTIGFNYELLLSNRVALRTGLHIGQSRGYITDNTLDTNKVCYFYSSTGGRYHTLLAYEDVLFSGPNTSYYLYIDDIYKRMYKFNQLTIPIDFYFRSRMKNLSHNFIKAGMQFSFLYSAIAKEVSMHTIRNVILRDVNRFQPKLSIGVGRERVIFGGTSIFISGEVDVPLRNYFKNNSSKSYYFLQGINNSDMIEPTAVNSSTLFNNHFYQIFFRVSVGFMF